MATLLVIGGSGFFGKSILDMFQRGKLSPWNINKVISMSRNAEQLKSETPNLILGNVELLTSDISNAEYLPEADFIIHAAASTDAKNYHLAPLKERSNIIRGTVNYCELAKKIHQKSKIVYVSSGAVYGPQPQDLEKIPENSIFLDADQLPENKRDYAYAKRDSEKAIIDLGLSGLNVSIARCFAFIGPWLPLDQHFAIGNFINDVLNRRSIKVRSNHKVYRSYMYADDLVEWLMTIADHASPNCPTYNVGSDQAILLSDLAKELSLRYNVLVEAPYNSESMTDLYIPSITKAKEEIGLYLKFDIFASIQETINRIVHHGK